MNFNIIYVDPPWRFANWSMNELATRGEKWARYNRGYRNLSKAGGFGWG